ncbi:iron only hydrogenase large subunit-like protein [Clostridium tetanomorphum]|uniref:4Fe-4S binding protein n=1 Tax=Clostridium tetanomorphum TaxID=1553 RepID=A0A923EAV2_CLOTT|nr:[Fe-Fe] hydrogenase large subunit C-terminal domain-containing protein [Clostridium tetanomorphum]KAJ50838.1 periplasmic [Fe] hydrogenase 1 [Clostridium tetanomorphum DSM 665]MBC2398329.1 4Fe-4S binding protein [Clostridium tetanomorphum]MBP1865481.1 iron only hydrogenase large subunit-like protein [Clostridium tetanomorphum]NRS86427.1 iron only hydrogenase large subunit-like protein [Clostridium tetanomorphum]NRZ95544.1 iron only hydrogenase large subunit-like protein [Clostridium tetanomo
MKDDYRKIFKELVRAYHQDKLNNKVEELIYKENLDKNKLAYIISSLCGVEVDLNENFSKNLEEAIKNYTPNHKVISKFNSCSGNCSNESSETLCQKSCPVNAIVRNPENNNIYINNELCLDCGMCLESCPNGGILDKVEFLPLLNLLKSKATVVAAVAPAIVGQLGENININQLRTAFKKLGFTDMVEVAFFADMLTLKEAVEYDHFVKSENDFMITSCCCPMWVGMLKRVYHDLVKYVSPSVSPMIASGRVLKAINPECKVVFVGPCVAKKAEAKEKDLIGDIDFVLTFTELKDIFDSLGINPSELEEDLSTEYASRGGRLYGRTGGVSIAVGEAIERLFPNKYKLLKTVQANGVKECKDILSKIKDGEIVANFIEGMGCVGGCVGGPKAILKKELGKEAVDSFADKSEIKVSVDSDCMKEILHKIGITSIEDFKEKEKIEIFERDF